MISLSSVLLDVDAAAADHPALERAADLAARCGAQLKIVDVLPWLPAGVRRIPGVNLEQELVAYRHGRLEALAASVSRIPVSTSLLRGRPATALVQEVLAGGHDLVVRSHDRDLAGSPRLYGAVDMELLRVCPCPVWLIGRGPSHTPRRIVAAVNAEAPEPTEQELNRTVTEWALTLRDLTGAGITLLYAWIPFGASLLEARLSETEFAEYLEEARRAADSAMRAFTDSFDGRLSSATIEVVRGEPDRAIADFVRSHEIDLVVLGTVARTGIPGLLMGNTAEHVLRRLQGSVLAVKPTGFVSPIAPA
ncbi:MAG TPA: universal stress protein [Vicinamibacterales bacterium]|nr:universal stress protein [Vicinamibacterales bacterium]